MCATAPERNKMNIKLNKNKVSFSQCNKMIKELNKNANINNIPIKLVIQKSLVQDNQNWSIIPKNTIKYKLVVFNLNTGKNKTEGTYTLPELQTHLFKHFIANK